MNKIKVAGATNNQLDWLVAKCEGWPATGYLSLDSIERNTLAYNDWGRFEPTTNPAQMWPIIEREGMCVHCEHDTPGIKYPPNRKWWSQHTGRVYTGYGPTSLIAAARCYVVSKLGVEVEVPEELI